MSMVRWKWEKWVDTFCFLLTFLLLFFSLFVSFGFGSLDFLEAGCVSAASFAFILRVRELLLARYPLVMSTDWSLTEDRVKLKHGTLLFHVYYKMLNIWCECGRKLQLFERFFTGYAFVGVILVLISTVFLYSIFRDGLHLNSRSVGQHTQVLKQALPRGHNAGWTHWPLTKTKTQTTCSNDVAEFSQCKTRAKAAVTADETTESWLGWCLTWHFIKHIQEIIRK